jgi:hypothetical protein
MMSSKICQYAALTSACAATGTLARTLSGAVDGAPLAQRPGEDLLHGAQQPRGAVADHQHRRSQPTTGQVGKDASHGSWPSPAAGARPRNTGLPVVVMP